jgi:lipopolysaccharide transport system ATP-binding protein
MKKVEVARKFDEIVDFSGVEKFIDTPVKRYSSGMYVRLAFAVAAHLDPEILIVDEVLAVGDAAFQKKCLGKMGEVAHEGRTVLFVSHNMGAITNLCHRGLLLDVGKVVTTGSPKEVVSQYLNSVVGCSGSEIELTKILSDAYFVRIAILDADDQPTQNVQVTSSFKIRLEYQVIKPIADLEVDFTLFDRHNSKLFYSGSSKDKKVKSLDHGVGHYVADVEVPANFLAPGMYSITAGLHRPNIQLYDRRDHVIGFSVLETGSVDYRYAGQDIGSILVNFDWIIERSDGKS